MKTTPTESRKQIVTRYSLMIRDAEKAWDTERADRLKAEMRKLIQR